MDRFKKWLNKQKADSTFKKAGPGGVIELCMLSRCFIRLRTHSESNSPPEYAGASNRDIQVIRLGIRRGKHNRQSSQPQAQPQAQHHAGTPRVLMVRRPVLVLHDAMNPIHTTSNLAITTIRGFSGSGGRIKSPPSFTNHYSTSVFVWGWWWRWWRGDDGWVVGACLWRTSTAPGHDRSSKQHECQTPDCDWSWSKTKQ